MSCGRELLVEDKIILKGIGRSKGYAAGEALVSPDPISFLSMSVDQNSGTIRMFRHSMNGISVSQKILIYPTAIGSTGGSVGLFFKCKISKVGPKAIICQRVHPIDIAGALAGEIPAVDGLDKNPLEIISTGDWVEIKAEKVGGEATVEIRKRANAS